MAERKTLELCKKCETCKYGKACIVWRTCPAYKAWIKRSWAEIKEMLGRKENEN